MTYQEAKWIIEETERLISCYESNSSLGMEKYRKVIPEGIYPTKIERMNIEEVAEIINSHYGVYQEDDIVTDRIGIPCLITHIDISDALSLHDVKYHVIYQGGITNVLSIDEIAIKLGSNKDVMGSCDLILGKYFDDELERIEKETK